MELVFKLVIFTLISSNILFAQENRGVNIEIEVKSLVSGKYHAIIISENQYQDPKITDLNEPQNDADKLFSVLTSKYFFHKNDILRLIDPTRADIIDAIEEKRKTLSIDDNLLIFYAGHGYWDENLKMGYWLPSDAKKDSKSNWVSNNDLTLYLSAIQANHILLISDACFSGGIFKTRSIGDMEQGTKRLYELKSRKAITSGNLKEVPDNSVFMSFFLKELENNEAAFLTSDQLFAKIRPAILNNSSTEPLYGVVYNTGDEGGEFVFYSPSMDENSYKEEANEMLGIIVNQEKKEVRSVISVENKILPNPKRIAIINFDNSSGVTSEFGDLGGPLRDMLTTDLNEVKNLSMVDRQALEKVLNEQNLNNAKRFDQNTATNIGKLLGAEIIITGTYFEFYGNLRLDAKLINVETGEILFSVGVDGSRDKLFDLKNALANKIIEKLK
jgi:TolB-like protein